MKLSRFSSNFPFFSVADSSLGSSFFTCTFRGENNSSMSSFNWFKKGVNMILHLKGSALTWRCTCSKMNEIKLISWLTSFLYWDEPCASVSFPFNLHRDGFCVRRISPSLMQRSLSTLTSTSFRRSHIQILASILEACQCRTCKTQVMSQCNLNSRLFEDYRDVLLKANLLAIESDNRFLNLLLSNKGKSFLNRYNSMKTMIEQP